MRATLKVIDGGQGAGRFRSTTKPESISPKPKETTSQAAASVTVVPVWEASQTGTELPTVGSLPPPPVTMPSEMRNEWNALMAHLKERRLLSDAILPIARAYIMAVHFQDEAEKSITKDGLFIEGASGAKKGNPAIALLRGAQGTIARMARQLALGDLSKRMPDDDGKQPSLFSEFDL